MPNPLELNENITPAQAFDALMRGNERFMADDMLHPDQDARRRSSTHAVQNPFVVVFGCSDSRVAAEIIFDRGLGDMFVVRTAGHVVDTTVLGSIEYGVDLLDVPLVVVLGHESCGAIAAAHRALTTGEMPHGMVRAIVDRVIPSLVTGIKDKVSANGNETLKVVTLPEPDLLGREHVKNTVQMLHGYSRTLADAVAAGTCAIVGAEYKLADGQVRVVEVAGDIGI